MWTLVGIAVIAAGFFLRLNPLAVVLAVALATGLAAGLHPVALLAAFGKAFNDSRFVTALHMLLPVIGLWERYGLQARARAIIAGLAGATTGRLLLLYLALRQVTAAIGLSLVGGHSQTVRPLLALMAQATAEAQGADADGVERVKAMAAATDNVGNFFGEDVFVAVGSILLMIGVLRGFGVAVEPFRLSVWAIPTALAAFAVHGLRLILLDRRLGRRP